MKLGIVFRLVALSLVVTLMGVLILLATLNSQWKSAELRGRLSQLDQESFQIVDQFHDSLRELGNTMQRYGTDHDPAIWNDYLLASRKLSVWIDEQKSKLTSPEEKDSLEQIRGA